MKILTSLSNIFPSSKRESPSLLSYDVYVYVYTYIYICKCKNMKKFTFVFFI